MESEDTIDLTDKTTSAKILSAVAFLESGSEVPTDFIEEVHGSIYKEEEVQSFSASSTNNNKNNKKF